MGTALTYMTIGYGLFLLIITAINLLYVFQILKYKLPGDASIFILTVHVLLVLAVMIGSTLVLSGYEVIKWLK